MHRTGTRGVTLAEILIAAAMLATMLVAILNLFANTQQQSASSETLLNTGTLAQLVLERIKSNISMNPRYLRDLLKGQPTWSFKGTAVDPAKAVSGGKLALSPFLGYLFNRESVEVCQPGNEIAISPGAGATASGIKQPEMQALFESFRDYEVDVQISDDDEPLGTAVAPGPAAEAVKRISVSVGRSSVIAASGKDPLAYTVTSRVSTPSESYSTEKFDKMAEWFDGPPLAGQLAEFYLLAGDNVYFKPAALGDDSKDVLADVFMILARANNEYQLIEGKNVDGTVIQGQTADSKYIDDWLLELEAPGVRELSSSRAAVAGLRGRKANIIFDAFKRSRLPMEHLITAVLGPRTAPPPLSDRISAVTELIKGFIAQIAQMDAAAAAAIAAYGTSAAALTAMAPDDPDLAPAQAAADAALATMTSLQSQLAAFSQAAQTQAQGQREFVVLVALLQQLLTDPLYTPVSGRPGDYDTRFRTTLTQLSDTVVAHLEQTPDATPYDRVTAAKLYYEVTAARQLEAGSLDAAALSRLKALSDEYRPRMLELSRYLAGTEVTDMAALTQRNKRFADRVAELHQLCPRYKGLVFYFSTDQPADVMIKLYESFAGKLGDTRSALGGLGKMLKAIQQGGPPGPGGTGNGNKNKNGKSNKNGNKNANGNSNGDVSGNGNGNGNASGNANGNANASGNTNGNAGTPPANGNGP